MWRCGWDVRHAIDSLRVRFTATLELGKLFTHAHHRAVTVDLFAKECTVSSVVVSRGQLRVWCGTGVPAHRAGKKLGFLEKNVGF